MSVNGGHSTPLSGVYKQLKKTFLTNFLAGVVILKVLHTGGHVFSIDFLYLKI